MFCYLKIIEYFSQVKHNAMSIDSLCEKYYWISPYVYCANNPIAFKTQSSVCKA